MVFYRLIRLSRSITELPFLFSLVFLCSVSTISTGQSQNKVPQTVTPREIAMVTLSSVVLVVMTDPTANMVIYGSGFFVEPDVIATNFHVIENTRRGYAKIVGEETRYEVVGVVAVDRENDLALLKLKGAIGKPLVPGDPSPLAIGDQVFAVGNPKGLEGTFSQGIISSIRRKAAHRLLQITAPISPGSSGGPVLNASGEVIGIAVGAVDGGQSLNFAIPTTYLTELLLKGANLLSLHIGARSITKRGLVDNARAGPDIPRPSRPISETTRRSFKKPDLMEGLPDIRSVGQVAEIQVSHHKFSEKFGEWQMTPSWETEKFTFNEFGNIEYQEGYNYKDFYDIQPYLDPPGKWDPSRYKRIYSYDYARQQIVEDFYWAPLTEKIFEYRGRDIEKYEGGERIDSSSYKPDGTLENKRLEYSQATGRRTSTWFQADGKKLSSEVYYTDSSGAKIYENQDENGTVTFRRVKTVTPEAIIEAYYNYTGGGTWSRSITIYDPRTELEIEATIYLGDRLTERTKTEYDFDRNLNWIRKVQYKEVTKFGKTYFEPQIAILRKITYRQFKPSTNSRRRDSPPSN